MPTDLRQSNFLDVRFDNATYEETARTIDSLARSDRFSYIVTANVDHMLCLHPKVPGAVNEQFRAAYRAAAMRLCDSRILRKLAAWKGVDLDVVTGSDLTAYLFREVVMHHPVVAIVGGDNAMLQELHERFPGPAYAQHRPPMAVLESRKAIDAIVEFVAVAQADFIFFAIGAPQSEIIAWDCLRSNRCRGVGLCIGASIEFLLGRKSRAPVWVQRLGMEWAYRLSREPGRLWKRYLLNGPRIFSLVAKWR